MFLVDSIINLSYKRRKLVFHYYLLDNENWVQNYKLYCDNGRGTADGDFIALIKCCFFFFNSSPFTQISHAFENPYNDRDLLFQVTRLVSLQENYLN